MEHDYTDALERMVQEGTLLSRSYYASFGLEHAVKSVFYSKDNANPNELGIHDFISSDLYVDKEGKFQDYLLMLNSKNAREVIVKALERGKLTQEDIIEFRKTLLDDVYGKHYDDIRRFSVKVGMFVTVPLDRNDSQLDRIAAEKVLDSLVRKQIGPQDEKQMKRINNIYHSVFISKEAHSMTAIYPGVSAGIEMLRKSGKKVGIVTNSYRHTLKRDVPKGLIDRLDIMITHETIKNPKPSGYGIKRAAEAVGESIRDTVYIGDTVVDVRAAKDAGCESASLLCGMGIRAHLENEGTDVVFKNLYSAAKVLIHG